MCTVVEHKRSSHSIALWTGCSLMMQTNVYLFSLFNQKTRTQPTSLFVSERNSVGMSKLLLKILLRSPQRQMILTIIDDAMHKETALLVARLDNPAQFLDLANISHRHRPKFVKHKTKTPHLRPKSLPSSKPTGGHHQLCRNPNTSMEFSRTPCGVVFAQKRTKRLWFLTQLQTCFAHLHLYRYPQSVHNQPMP